MITPRFSCSQTEATVIIRIYTPSVRTSDIELLVDGTLFSLHVNPYFLRLVFPGPVLEDDASSAVYDPVSGYLTVTLTKASPGHEFEDLDVLSKLLAPPRCDEPAPRPSIEVIGSEEAQPGDQDAGDGIEEATEDMSLHQREVFVAAENDWHLPQQLPETPEPPSINLASERRYGFLDAYTGYFRHVGSVENEVNELGPNVEKLSPEERRSKRLAHEDEKWDEEYYMADYVDDETIQEMISYKPPPGAPCSPALPDPMVFTEQENIEMLRLPRKEYLPTPQQTHNLYLTLLTILFSYSYDARTTQNDPTPESTWTICALTPAFSALDPAPYSPRASTPLTFTPQELQETLKPSVRRVLAFPLYRHFALAEKCLQDVSVVLQHGRRAVLRALLDTKKILEGHEVYYIYSKIWVEDFCRWAASDVSEDILRSLGEMLASTEMDKRVLGWDILALEVAARRQREETTMREPDSDDESDPGLGRALSPKGSEDDKDESFGAAAKVGTSSVISSTSSSASTLSSSSSDTDLNNSSESGSVSISSELGISSSSHTSTTGP